MAPRAWQGPGRDERVAAAARLRGQGLSLRQIGRRLGVSYMTASRDLARSQPQREDGDHGQDEEGRRGA